MHDFFHSTAFRITWAASAAVVRLAWGAPFAWVRKAARRRSGGPRGVWVAALSGAIPPFLGPLLCVLFGPRESRDRVRERQGELRMTHGGLAGGDITCWVCSARV